MANEPDDVLVWRARSRAPETTEALGRALGETLPPGALVALVGELGSGKTTFTRGLALGLDVSEPVVSPTFTRLRVLPGRLTLYHFDAWRGGAEALYEEAQDFLAGEGVAVVEWADRIAARLPRPRIELQLAHAGAEERTFAAWLRAPPLHAGPGARALAETLAAALDGARGTAGLVLDVR